MSVSRSSVAEYMKIRRHVLNLVAKAGSESVQLPTALELSKQFGVCRQTVGKALKQLAADRFVIGKPGLGTFTNPKRKFRFNPQKKSLTIGIIVGDGMVIEMDEYLANLVAACLMEVVTCPAYVRTINLTSTQPDLVLKELRNEFLDGFLWHNPPPGFRLLLENLVQEQIPVVAIGSSPTEKVSCVQFDSWDFGYKIGKLLLKAEKKQVVFLQDELPWNRSADGLRMAFRESGVAYNEKFFLKGNDVLEKLNLIFELGVDIDAIVNPLYPYEDLAEIAKNADYDLSRTLHVCWESVAKDFPEFRGIAYSFDFPLLARRAVALLRRQMEEKEFAAVHELVPVELHVQLENCGNMTAESAD